MKIINVLGCGVSGANWNGRGYCIGVNDCLKFGKEVDRLIVVNKDFEPERMAYIQNARPVDGLWSQMAFWVNHPCYKLLQTRKFTNVSRADVIYHSITSPFIALSMAAFMGANMVVLHGVDFVGHQVVKDDTLDREKDAYLRYISLLQVRGVNVYLGSDYGVFKDSLPIA